MTGKIGEGLSGIGEEPSDDVTSKIGTVAEHDDEQPFRRIDQKLADDLKEAGGDKRKAIRLGTLKRTRAILNGPEPVGDTSPTGWNQEWTKPIRIAVDGTPVYREIDAATGAITEGHR